jgi:preprotein translocase subunit SecG
MIFAICFLILSITPLGSSQKENVTIVNYSYHIDSSGVLVAVGEVQNTGSTIISQIIMSGTAIPTFGDEVVSGDLVWATNMLPGQKAPFLIEFKTSSTDNGVWIAGISDVTVKVLQASASTQYQYQDITITEHQASLSSGSYIVSGEVKNTGTETATNVQIVATFFNAEGKPVAVGYSSSMATIAPDGIDTFDLSALGLNQTYASSANKIESYKLLVQVEAPIQSGTLPSAAAEITGSLSGTTNSANNLDLTTIAILVVIIVVVLVVAILLTRRKSLEISSNKKSKRPQQHKKRRR